jgi:type IV secretory pathway ATPase VirB11/archaellum biosynthesis ATPase
MTQQQQKRQEAVEAMNKKVGYDVPLCYATLNTIVINEETDMGEIPLIEKRTAMAVIAEVIANMHGGRLTLDAVADIMQSAIAYGWHWAREGESMLRSESVRTEIMDYLRDRMPQMPLDEYTRRKEGLERGFEELRKVVEKVEHGIRLQRQLKVKS